MSEPVASPYFYRFSAGRSWIRGLKDRGTQHLLQRRDQRKKGFHQIGANDRRFRTRIPIDGHQQVKYRSGAHVMHMGAQVVRGPGQRLGIPGIAGRFKHAEERGAVGQVLIDEGDHPGPIALAQPLQLGKVRSLVAHTPKVSTLQRT